tara:strand:- start:140 stop:634 length:495 start_codon:yes stop_codon:yes gene_type:complete
MSYFIIIRGPLGSGKSTIAKSLAKELKAEYIEIDKVLEDNNLDKIDEKEGCISSKNFVKANKIILPEIKKIIKDKIVIFDACFYHKEPIEHLIKNIAYPNYVFTLKAPISVCIERDKKRNKNHGEGAARAVHNLVSRFDYGIIIDTKKDKKDTIKEILSNLPRN